MTRRLFLIYLKGFDVKIGWKVSKTKCLWNVTKLELLILMFLLGGSTFTPVRRLYYRIFSNLVLILSGHRTLRHKKKNTEIFPRYNSKIKIDVDHYSQLNGFIWDNNIVKSFDELTDPKFREYDGFDFNTRRSGIYSNLG